jgi:hypothetical protein
LRQIMPARIALSIALTFVAALASAQSAAAQAIPIAPSQGARIQDADVVLRWTLDPGWQSECIEWSGRPETSYDGGPFLDPFGGTCDLGAQDVAYLLKHLEVRGYFWHVEAGHETCDPETGDCTEDERWGPTAYFDSVEPPPPSGCSRAAAEYAMDSLLLPYARRHLRRYYRGITGWFLTKRLCRDLDGDGDREMAILLNCCTGGSIGPWAIFKHGPDHQWRIAYAQIRETTWRLQVRGRTVRGLTPAPYEGACTRHTRWREVRWNGRRWRSRLSARHRVHLGPACR